MEGKITTIVDKALDKIPVDKVYEDLAQAGLQKAGRALADIIEVVTLPLLPLLHAKKRVVVYLDSNLRQYEEKLNEKRKEPSKVPAFLGVPILQKLTFLSQGELAEAFINLLTNASFDDSIHKVHPAFISTLSDLSRDEAVILQSLKTKKSIPCIDMEVHFMEQHDAGRYAFTRTPLSRLTGFEKTLALHFPNNIELYLRNLERLGIFAFRNDALANRDDDYRQLEDYYSEDIGTMKDIAAQQSEKEGRQFEAKIVRLIFEITPFGRDFIQACLSD
ncbi:DUF4393 domain-containing protein [Dyadobacter sp. OTU695]|uniref:DUF4393 domain-containing protein n=1 Tax=Dyadobacter sp. OTU695 TaxID=3043860 RepID=UPI00313E4157